MVSADSGGTFGVWTAVCRHVCGGYKHGLQKDFLKPAPTTEALQISTRHTSICKHFNMHLIPTSHIYPRYEVGYKINVVLMYVTRQFG